MLFTTVLLLFTTSLMLFTVFLFGWKTQLCGKHKIPLGKLGLGAEQRNAQRSDKGTIRGIHTPYTHRSLNIPDNLADSFEVSGRSLSQSNRIRVLTFSIAAPKSCMDETDLMK